MCPPMTNPSAEIRSPRAWRDDASAQQLAAGVKDQLGQPFFDIFRDVAVIAADICQLDPRIQPRRFRRCFSQADLGQLGVGVGDPWDGFGIGLGRHAEEHLSHHNRGMMARHMGKLRAANDIANGEDMPLAGAHVGANGDALRGVIDPGCVEVQSLDGRLTPGRDQQVRGAEYFGTAAGFEREADIARSAADG